LVFFFFVVVDESSLEVCEALEAEDESSAVFFFFFFLVVVELSDWLWSVDWGWAARKLNVPNTSSPINKNGKYSL
jgi:hypothetical protein